MKQWVYLFQQYPQDLQDDIRARLGGKGAGLVEMCRLGLPVPPGCVVTTDVCNAFYKARKTFPEGVFSQLTDALVEISSLAGGTLGDPQAPLLLSVRSGSKASMPGMMDTILNLGLNDQTVEGLKAQSGDGRFAYDSYRRFIQMYSNVVLGLGLHAFEEILAQYKNVRQVAQDSDLSEDDLKSIVAAYKQKILQMSGAPFPQDVTTQLHGAVGAVVKSWMNPRAVAYREIYNIPEDWGTAVIVQAMVFGNLGEASATGVAFTRNPSTGERVFFGEYLIKAQGEDVVAGIRTPQPLTIQQKQSPHQVALEEVMPEAFQELVVMKDLLEKHFHDMQDIEFTIQNTKLWLLQTRNGKRTAPASLRIAVDMVDEGLISRKEALLRFDPPTLDQLLHPQLSDTSDLVSLGFGLPASPGAAIGRVCFSVDSCKAQVALGEAVLLVREETSPEDIEGMALAQGILTARGGMTSHAAVVARGMGKPCVVGVGEMYIDSAAETFSLNGVKIEAGDILTLNGGTGEIFKGQGKVCPPLPSATFHEFMSWADEVRRLRVRANAETPQDVEAALAHGAEGIGLCRTEHMFFQLDRILAVRQMILADSVAARNKALEAIIPMQRNDFLALFRLVQGLPVTVRLLDPPLHEFLPRGESEIDQLAHALQKPLSAVRHRIAELDEVNPMLGLRGARLGVTAPEIYKAQLEALITAALQASAEGIPVSLEIMIPLISLAGEFHFLRQMVDRKVAKILKHHNTSLAYKVGTMIELPRAALKAGKIAQWADFLSFGTNDLTQTTFGFSRDDAGSFLSTYRQKGLVDRDPFMSLDQSGVGELIQLAVQRARQTKPDIKIGVCGEQGADPSSIQFFDTVGVDYVSCSPYRLPVARLSAAQATLREGV